VADLIKGELFLLRSELVRSRRIQAHIHEGEFISKFPLIPGHEAVGTIVAMGDKVTGFDKGDRIAADVGGGSTTSCRPPASSHGPALISHSETCGWCHFCRRGEELFCEHFTPAGVARDGGFADYIK
jgi:D-arabinitol dehydrogenase (NADP+)